MRKDSRFAEAPGRRPEAPQTQCTVMEEPAYTKALGQESGIYVDIYIVYQKEMK